MRAIICSHVLYKSPSICSSVSQLFSSPYKLLKTPSLKSFTGFGTQRFKTEVLPTTNETITSGARPPNKIPFVNGQHRTGTEGIAQQLVAGVVLEVGILEPVLAQTDAGYFMIGVYVFGFVQGAPRTSLDAYLERVPQLLHVEEQQERFVRHVEAGQVQVAHGPVPGAARVAERIVPVYYADGVAVDEGKRRHEHLKAARVVNPRRFEIGGGVTMKNQKAMYSASQNTSVHVLTAV